MKKYGLQLRIPPNQQKKMQSQPSIRPPASIFGDDDDDDAAAKEISQQAFKSRALRMIDEEQKKVLEEDPSAFDYDGVYDEMKSKAVRSRVEDQIKREPKYITSIIETAKKREREHEVIYERKLLKERSKDDHIYEDKEKFVTSAYKKKLAERAQWLEEERLRGLREEKDDVTKKSDLTDFYFSLNKNVAFGANPAHTSTSESSKSNAEALTQHPQQATESYDKKTPISSFFRDAVPSSDSSPPIPQDKGQAAAPASDTDGKQAALLERNRVDESSSQSVSEDKRADKMDGERFKRSEDAVAAARERFLARKKAREEQL